MHLDLMTMPPEEAERLAYAEGFTGTATLFGRLADAERERDTLAKEVETLREERDDLERELSNLRESLRDLLEE